MRITGYSRYSFNPEEGKFISGATFYCAVPILKNGVGFRPVDGFKLTDAKIADMIPFVDLDEIIGRDVRVLYDRYGKVAHIEFM